MSGITLARRTVIKAAVWLVPAASALLAVEVPAVSRPSTAASSYDPAVVVPRRAITLHMGRFNGVTVSYEAVVEDNIVSDNAGKPGGTIVTVAYLRDGVEDLARRPVLFAFNGGPGAAAAQLNTRVLGPLIRSDTVGATTGGVPAAGARLIPNPASILDAVDLVFIDPVGTGVSRALPGVDAKQFYDGDADARTVAQAINNWLRVHGRASSPRYVIGESYGTQRAGLLLRDGRVHFDGVMLVALVGHTPGPDLPFITSLPTMAAGHWYHDPASRAGRSLQQVYTEAVRFAQTDYAMALIRGGSLPEQDRLHIADRLSTITGLERSLVLANNLRIPTNVWMFNLLKSRGVRTGMLDVRLTAPLPADEKEEGAIDDPALNVVPVARKGSKPFNPADVGPVPNPIFGAHLVRDLRFPTTETYYAINFSANAEWHQNWDVNTVLPIAAAMRADPKLRLFWSAGLYDLTTPAYAARYTLDQAGIPSDRLTAKLFEGPHGVYDSDANRRTFAQAVRTFILGLSK